MSEMRAGVVYTETIVFSPPERYASDAPYQLAIVDLENGERKTVRIVGREAHERARIGERVVFAEERDGVEYYRKDGVSPTDERLRSPRPLV